MFGLPDISHLDESVVVPFQPRDKGTGEPSDDLLPIEAPVRLPMKLKTGGPLPPSAP